LEYVGGFFAKAEPAFRSYVLYDKICREDILDHANRMARANAGAPGVDGVTFSQIEEQGPQRWLAGLREELVSKTADPDPPEVTDRNSRLGSTKVEAIK
jgi:RNA-directed DNA polymerase